MRGQITETTDPEKPDSYSGRRRKLKFGAKERSNCLPGGDFILSYIDHISYIYDYHSRTVLPVPICTRKHAAAKL